MKVKHALIAFNQDLYTAASEGKISAKDENGFILGLDGALSDGAKIFAERSSSEP